MSLWNLVNGILEVICKQKAPCTSVPVDAYPILVLADWNLKGSHGPYDREREGRITAWMIIVHRMNSQLLWVPAMRFPALCFRRTAVAASTLTPVVDAHCNGGLIVVKGKILL